MNLHGLAAGMVGIVNPQVPVIIRVSTGNVTGLDGTPSPRYASPVTVQAQVQELTTKDLRQVDGLNLNGTNRSLYLNGAINAGQRVSLKGGDVIVLGDGTVWLVTAMIEVWPDWCKAIITLQNDSSSAALLQALAAKTY